MTEFYSANSLLNICVRGRTSNSNSGDAQPVRWSSASAPGGGGGGAKTRSGRFFWGVETHVLAKLSRCSGANEKKIPQLRSTVLRSSLLRKSRQAQPPLFSGLRSGFVVEAHILGSSAEVVGLPSAMRPLPITNGKEERREKSRGRGDVAALATALLSATARF